MIDWTQVLIAAFAGVPATAAAIATVVLSVRNLRKLDDNTNLTKSASAAAAVAVKSAKASAEDMARQINGILDERITTIVTTHTDPLYKIFSDHNEQDQQNMTKIEKAILMLGESVPKKIAADTAKVAADTVKQAGIAESSNVFTKGVEHGIKIGKEHARLEMERERLAEKESLRKKKPHE